MLSGVSSVSVARFITEESIQAGWAGVQGSDWVTRSAALIG